MNPRCAPVNPRPHPQSETEATATTRYRRSAFRLSGHVRKGGPRFWRQDPRKGETGFSDRVTHIGIRGLPTYSDCMRRAVRCSPATLWPLDRRPQARK